MKSVQIFVLVLFSISSTLASASTDIKHKKHSSRHRVSASRTLASSHRSSRTHQNQSRAAAPIGKPINLGTFPAVVADSTH